MITTAWFLVSIVSGQYLGPMSEQECQNAGKYILSSGIVCRQADKLVACPVAGKENTYTSCPVFDFPQVTTSNGGQQ